MTPLATDQVRARARQLYEDGSSTLDAIASALNVSVMSLLRWRRDAAREGRPWLRPGEPTPEEKMRLKLQRRLAALAEEAEKLEGRRRKEYPCLEDRMLKVCRILDHLRPDGEDLTAQLAGLKKFAAFCTQNLSEVEMQPVRKAIRMFLDRAKEEAS